MDDQVNKLQRHEAVRADDHVMPLAGWVECVRDGGFIDYDGYGELVRDSYKLGVCVSPSDLESGEYEKRVAETGATHVCWYNR